MKSKALKESINKLKLAFGAGEHRYKFPYADYGDTAELVVTHSSHWGNVPPKVELIAHPGAWQNIAAAPTTLLSKAMTRAAEKASGLKLALRAQPWKPIEDGAMTRELVLVGDNTGRLREMFPASASA